MKCINRIGLIAFITFPATGFSQRLDLFASQTGLVNTNGISERIPYDETAGFYDLLIENQLSDSIIDDKNYYFVYFNIPYAVTEIGVRMISPVPAYVFPEGGDVVTAHYESNKKTGAYFNPWIAIEKGISDQLPGKTVLFTSWEQLGKNDDSVELLPQPSGLYTNSLLRMYQGPYLSGIYRVKFRSVEKGIPVGSYLLQVGSVPGIKRLKMSRTVQGLFEE